MKPSFDFMNLSSKHCEKVSVSFTDQPNGGRDQNCVMMEGFGSYYGDWWDVSCLIKLAYVCSKPSSGENNQLLKC